MTAHPLLRRPVARSSRIAVHFAVAIALAATVAACSKARGDDAVPGEATISADGAVHSGDPLPLRVVQDVALSGGTTRFDYQDLDPVAHRLYVAHLGDGTVEVLDTDHLSLIATIGGIDGVHGVRLASDRHRLFASATGLNQMVSIDTDTDTVVSRTSTGNYPDGLAYEPRLGKVYVSNEHDTAETVVDAGTGRRLTSIDLGGEAGNSSLDPVTGSVMVNVQTKQHLAVIDPATDTVTATIDTPGCESNHGLYVEPDHHVAFVACEGNARLLTIDLDTKTTTGSYDVGEDPDVLAFDPGRRRLYVAAESGTLAVFDETGKTLRPLARTKVADNAHTVAVDPRTHRVFLPLQDLGGRPVLRVMEPTDANPNDTTEPAR